jgi:hypothetical protein
MKQSDTLRRSAQTCRPRHHNNTRTESLKTSVPATVSRQSRETAALSPRTGKNECLKGQRYRLPRSRPVRAIQSTVTLRTRRSEPAAFFDIITPRWPVMTCSLPGRGMMSDEIAVMGRQAICLH